MWFDELGRSDPLPINVRMPLPNMRLDLRVFPVSHGFLVGAPPEEEDDMDSEIIEASRSERMDPLLIGGGILGLFYLINQ